MEIVKTLHVKFFPFGSVEPVGSVTVKKSFSRGFRVSPNGEPPNGIFVAPNKFMNHESLIVIGLDYYFGFKSNIKITRVIIKIIYYENILKFYQCDFL